ncbi:MAG: peroxiredoxin [Erysipelotrichaceae bacterium]|nr:peroxiredoxin [Erysipelotrichaceae bacterium]
MLNINSKAPDFNLEDFKGEKYSLSDFKGKNVILYFYPKDNTSGCTIQAINFSELKNDFNSKNTIIIGISKDSKKSHKSFIDKNNLSIILLSDENLEVIKLYDVWKEKMNYGKKYMGVVRTTYIIDKNGIITHAFEKVNAKTNAQDMLDIL